MTSMPATPCPPARPGRTVLTIDGSNAQRHNGPEHVARPVKGRTRAAWQAGAMPDDSVWIRRARELATSVFAPAAMTVEASQRVPPEHLDLLAAEGFYGLAGPREAGGLDVPFPVACRIIEILAGACLSTTFVWMQHHGVVRAVAAGPAALRQEMLGPLCRGAAAGRGGPGRPAAGPAPAARPRRRRRRRRVRARRRLTVGHGLGLHRHPVRRRPAGR